MESPVVQCQCLRKASLTHSNAAPNVEVPFPKRELAPLIKA